MLDGKKCTSQENLLESLGETIHALRSKLSLTLQSSSVSRTINAQIELPDNMTRSDQANAKKMIRTRIVGIIGAQQPRAKCRLSDGELVLLALNCCSDEWLLVSQVGEFALKSTLSPIKQRKPFRSILEEDPKHEPTRLSRNTKSRTKCRLSDGSLLGGAVSDSSVRQGYHLRYPFTHQSCCANEQRSLFRRTVLPLAPSLASNTLRELSTPPLRPFGLPGGTDVRVLQTNTYWFSYSISLFTKLAVRTFSGSRVRQSTLFVTFSFVEHAARTVNSF